jgi:hypothetical protein
MKAYKYEIVVVDFEGAGKEEVTELLRMNRYINPIVLSVKEADIGEWSDDHPINKGNTITEYCEKAFA